MCRQHAVLVLTSACTHAAELQLTIDNNQLAGAMRKLGLYELLSVTVVQYSLTQVQAHEFMESLYSWRILTHLNVPFSHLH